MAHEPDLEWHTIRPWTRRISLQIRDVTSVSVTFVLRSSMGASHSETLAALGSDSDEDDDTSRRMPTISDILGRGLAVKVNGNNWKRADVHVDEDEEEAIVIVYGLVPRKKYEISLGIGVTDEPIRETITTQSRQVEPAPADSPVAPSYEHVTDSVASPSTLTPPTTPIRSSPPRTITQEERTAQLRKQLAIINAERDDLASQLKNARRESQRTETALKGEIEALKRASEKHASGEHRSRQKVLALQEAVKQASAAAGDIEEMVREIEEAIPSLNTRADEVQAEHDTVKAEAERRGAETEASLQADRKMVADLQGELRGVCSRLEKVTGKQEKLEKEVVPQLEERLQELRREIREIERAALGEDYSQHGNEEAQGPWSARNWVPPIQRPSPQQRPNFTSSTNSHATTSHPPSRQTSFRSAPPPNPKRSNATLPPQLPSYDQSFVLRGSVASEITPDTNALPSRVTSDLKSGSTFHTPPRFQTQNTSYNYSSPFDFVVRRPSPNPTNNGREPHSRHMSLPAPECYFEGDSEE